jgi:WhiB family redox-sensing transcriptional regulator
MNPGTPFREALQRLVPDWHEQALCREVDPELFFPEKGGNVRQGLMICQRCPVAVPCLDAAIDNDERFGIWGGATDEDRKLIRQTRAPRIPDRSVSVARRRESVKNLRASGLSLDEIARELGITSALVAKDLERIRDTA